MVPEMNMGLRSYSPESKSVSMANSAALALSVSKMVSTSITSAPPSISPRACSAYASTISSHVTLRYAGFSTDGDSDNVRLVGPNAPAT